MFELLISFLQIGAFSIGGGYATLPLIQEQIVELHQWLTYKEFTDIITISQMTPGPLAVNGSTFVGLRIGGIPGAIVATFGCVISGILISLSLHRFFQKNHSPCIEQTFKALKSISVGLIASASSTILLLSWFGCSSWANHQPPGRFNCRCYQFCSYRPSAQIPSQSGPGNGYLRHRRYHILLVRPILKKFS